MPLAGPLQVHACRAAAVEPAGEMTAESLPAASQARNLLKGVIGEPVAQQKWIAVTSCCQGACLRPIVLPSVGGACICEELFGSGWAQVVISERGCEGARLIGCGSVWMDLGRQCHEMPQALL